MYLFIFYRSDDIITFLYTCLRFVVKLSFPLVNLYVTLMVFRRRIVVAEVSTHAEVVCNERDTGSEEKWVRGSFAVANEECIKCHRRRR